ncbi:MAG: low molecular weight phosphotyrosine protein phosphatase [Nitrospina sp.]|mgnify:CR=1 FL=1|jgi:protein-tyrosine phosphatase|nr:low molecular weight phosphotyrosine protein phosphatase [Nitrospina sp.]
MNKTLSVCFVCHGNICRSPLAQGVMESLVKQEDLGKTILVSSAGVSGWHVGEPPDTRMQDTAQQNGISLNSLGRHFQSHDFKQMDLVLAMDHSNLNTLKSLRPIAETQDKLYLFRSFDPQNNGDLEVPDPYYGGDKGFQLVYEMVERTCPKILEHLKAKLDS